jgi:KDO2-lipid IV(A) lauroyltransferase
MPSRAQQMSRETPRFAVAAARQVKRAGDAVLGRVFVSLFRGLRLLDRRRTANLTAFVTRNVGRLLKEHHIGRANLIAAFPEKSPAEIEEILMGAWDNLGRVAAEFAHIDRLRILDPAQPGPPDIIYDEFTLNMFHALRLDGKPALIFSSHLANWELTAYIAARYKLDAHLLYRRPNLRAVDDAVREVRADAMGTLVATGLDAPVKLLRVIEAGGHVAMLVDQYFVNGVDVTFFGRACKANPLIAQLARHTEAPIHGTRIIRLPERDRFRAEITGPIEPARDAQGKVDVRGTMQVITSMIEGWVREHPEQWLWMHRRWR